MNHNFFESGDYQRIAEFAVKTAGILNTDSWIERGERKQKIQGFAQLLNWMLSQAKQGCVIQRYKGLGEMNPDQLWETTMDPETRIMLQVTIEDAIACDQMFTTLMGDQVEPRREFIEQNALAVGNLDI